MTDEALLAACGLFCGTCEHMAAGCPGCAQIEGRPFWAAQFGVEVCPIYDCCMNTRQLEHCGLCDELPCETFLSLRDPSLSDEEFERSIEERREVLHARKERGAAAALAMMKAHK